MDAELLAIARTLAEGGHLPGIYVGAGATTNGNTMVVAPRLYCQSHPQDACTEADIHLACHNAIMAKGWGLQSGCTNCTQETKVMDGLGYYHYERGTTTLSLLRAYAAALEAGNAKGGGGGA